MQGQRITKMTIMSRSRIIDRKLILVDDKVKRGWSKFGWRKSGLDETNA
jgi:hypothetical protein